MLFHLTKPQLSATEADVERRKNLVEALHGEYILSHNDVSSGLLSGTESPPVDWMNKRLQELGEQWAFSANPTPKGRPAVTIGGPVTAGVDYGNLEERTLSLIKNLNAFIAHRKDVLQHGP